MHWNAEKYAKAPRGKIIAHKCVIIRIIVSNALTYKSCFICKHSSEVS